MKMNRKISEGDPDGAKGAIETEEHHHNGNLGLSEQLGHRDQDPILKDADTDFPEPGDSPEHSGEDPKLKAVVKNPKRK